MHPIGHVKSVLRARDAATLPLVTSRALALLSTDYVRHLKVIITQKRQSGEIETKRVPSAECVLCIINWKLLIFRAHVTISVSLSFFFSLFIFFFFSISFCHFFSSTIITSHRLRNHRHKFRHLLNLVRLRLPSLSLTHLCRADTHTHTHSDRARTALRAAMCVRFRCSGSDERQRRANDSELGGSSSPNGMMSFSR